MSGLPIRLLRGGVVLLLSAAVLAAVAGTLHWPIVGDAPLFHYVAFLMDHGKVPYRDIVDINMPGTYALQWAAIHTLGGGALAWRFFDFGLVALCGAAMIVVARRVDWLGGFFAAALFTLIHFRDGPTHTGQRDLMMTAMLLPACALLFEAVRQRRPRARMPLAAGFGLCAGMAAVIKPSGVFFAAALAVMLWIHLRAELQGKTATLLAAGVGFLLPVLACLQYLVRHDALRAFFDTNRGLVAYHAALGRPSFFALLVGSFPSVLLAVVIPAVPLFFVGKAWRGWEARAVIVCAALGGISYVLQGKGFPYHRYPAEAFLLLGCGVLLFRGSRVAPQELKPGSLTGTNVGAEAPTYRSLPSPKENSHAGTESEPWSAQSEHHANAAAEFTAHRLLAGCEGGYGGWQRWVALAGILLGALYLAPASAVIACHYDWRNQEFNKELSADFDELGGSAQLHEQVQCVDMTAGCLNTLYNLEIVQATGFLYDCYLFQPQQTAVSLRYREDFWRALTAAKPRVLVVTNQQCFSMTRDWTQPDRWPQFAALLRSDYTLAKQYTPPHLVAWWRKPAVPYSYRLYVRKGDAPSQLK